MSEAFRARSRSFGGGRQMPLSKGMTVAIAVPIGALFLAHLLFGANQAIAAQILTALSGLMLVGALMMPALRRGLSQLPYFAIFATLFVAAIAIAVLSITPGTPAPAHAIWEWAGEPGSVAVNRSAVQLEIFKLTGLAALFVLGGLMAMGSRWVQRVTMLVVWSGAVWAGLSLLMFVGGVQIGTPGRLSGGFISANTAATVIGLLLVMTLAATLRAWRRTSGQRKSDRFTAIGPLAAVQVLFLFALALTGSRLGVAATVSGVAVLLVWEALSNGKVAIRELGLATVIVVVSAVVIGAGSDLALTRVVTIGQDAADRAEIFRVHWNVFLQAPVFGHGLGAFSDINSYLLSGESFRELWRLRAAHNLYLQWLEEGGLLGTLPIAIVVVAVLIKAALVGSSGARGAGVVRGLCAASVVVLVHATGDYALQVPSVAALFALLLGLQWGASAPGRG